ncbi:MAG: DUF4399 domain-containing protein [Pseudomonadota bacterium]
MRKLAILIAATAVAFAGSAHAGETPSPPGAKVYFANLEDGDTVASPVTIIFALSGMGVAPAGVEKENTGHHHLFVDRAPFGEGEDGPEEAEFNIPDDGNHIHFGGGQTEIELELTPGEHTLQLVLADQNHLPHDPPVVSDRISITVE